MIEAIALLLAASLAFTFVGIGVLFLHRILLGSASDFEGRGVSASTSFRISAIYSLVLGLIFSGVSNQFTEALIPLKLVWNLETVHQVSFSW